MKNQAKTIIQDIAGIYCKKFPELNQQDIEDASTQVSDTWTTKADELKGPIEYLIIGEATQNLDNYFYNPSSKTTPFLSPSHFGCSSKSELLRKLEDLNAMVFDLYPLAIATSYYDKKAIAHSPLLKGLMKDYYKLHLDGRINQETQIVVRYAKLFNRIEWEYFKEFLMSQLGLEPSNPSWPPIHSIAGRANFADRGEVNGVFRPLI
jgi:hypothetical protein